MQLVDLLFSLTKKVFFFKIFLSLNLIFGMVDNQIIRKHVFSDSLASVIYAAQEEYKLSNDTEIYRIFIEKLGETIQNLAGVQTAIYEEMNNHSMYIKFNWNYIFWPKENGRFVPYLSNYLSSELEKENLDLYEIADIKDAIEMVVQEFFTKSFDDLCNEVSTFLDLIIDNGFENREYFLQQACSIIECYKADTADLFECEILKAVAPLTYHPIYTDIVKSIDYMESPELLYYDKIDYTKFLSFIINYPKWFALHKKNNIKREARIVKYDLDGIFNDWYHRIPLVLDALTLCFGNRTKSEQQEVSYLVCSVSQPQMQSERFFVYFVMKNEEGEICHSHAIPENAFKKGGCRKYLERGSLKRTKAVQFFNLFPEKKPYECIYKGLISASEFLPSTFYVGKKGRNISFPIGFIELETDITRPTTKYCFTGYPLVDESQKARFEWEVNGFLSGPGRERRLEHGRKKRSFIDK